MNIMILHSLYTFFGVTYKFIKLETLEKYMNRKNKDYNKLLWLHSIPTSKPTFHT